ncbi:CRISPR-associated protein Cas4 [Paenibacillus yanchengensis]|uniref:CRISPR-associated exonuclease Cas4 n=1 Tax=Paenibacillus yanchengensis TaxID=2035833 RepID=A0ABW4YJ14_9BACL
MGDNSDNNYLLLSGIQHFQFCKRQWALIHIEQQWEENVLTIEGQHLHQKADEPFIREKRGDKIIARAMPVQSRTYGITGRCDVVEFVADEQGVELAGYGGKYIVVPVEYKRGKPKRGKEDIVQIVAQALCLEEMLVTEISTGFIFYNETKQRIQVNITEQQKQETIAIITEMQRYYQAKHTPKVKTGPFCKSCSLKHICLPKLMRSSSVQSYIDGRVSE